MQSYTKDLGAVDARLVRPHLRTARRRVSRYPRTASEPGRANCDHPRVVAFTSCQNLTINPRRS
jgi:hypothetical protein